MSENIVIFEPAPPVVTARDRRLRAALASLEGLIKRAFDLLGSALGLVLLAPLFLAIAFVVAMDGGPVFFSHKRVGKNNKIFDCWKFRTMVVGAEECLQEYLRYHPKERLEWERDQKLGSDPRITPIGVKLRRTSLDELPQLWNVLTGDMSLVGPRPVTEIEMCSHYGPDATLVTMVRPGLTGRWQISGRNEVDYRTRVKLDAEYVRSRSLYQDFTILIQTVPVVLRRTGAR